MSSVNLPNPHFIAQIIMSGSSQVFIKSNVTQLKPSLSLQVKASFTRAYNKESHLTPYSLQIVKKGRRGAADADLGLDPENEQGQEEEEEEEGLTVDAMIKVNTTNAEDLSSCFLSSLPFSSQCLLFPR